MVATGRRLLHHSLSAYAVLALGYLLAPIAIILLFSFNDPAGRFNFEWKSFTLDNWANAFEVSDLTDAFVTSLEVAVVATVISTILGTLMALALVRYEFRGRPPVNFFIFLPLATPEVVLGAALLSVFLSFSAATGFVTIVIAHVMFCVSFVVVTVRSRLIGFDRSLEEAAQDLGATGPQTFLRVTLPLIMPGVLAGGLLAFALSIDDYVITSFNSGSTVTYPLWIFGASQRGVPPQVNVLAAMIFLFTVAIMVFTVWQQRRAEKLAGALAE
ncbi:MAG TPA: ABC transporter permease [Thermoleophilaceae bacterium]|nr:ABC transporter permease [Thermoleophilaceae bacterium]